MSPQRDGDHPRKANTPDGHLSVSYPQKLASSRKPPSMDAYCLDRYWVKRVHIMPFSACAARNRLSRGRPGSQHHDPAAFQPGLRHQGKGAAQQVTRRSWSFAWQSPQRSAWVTAASAQATASAMSLLLIGI
jgi:hypothetical protein